MAHGPRPEDAPLVPGRFVVHLHHASHLHFDLRLELGGVFVSWAVPKGPTLDATEKRLAVMVEEHPLDYGDFEGNIAPGNYGAGAVINWDRGRFIPIPEAEYPRPLADGKLLFDLEGFKLKGRFALVRTKRDPRHWLLLKKPDAYASQEPLPMTSVLSGRTVEQVARAVSAGDEVKAELERLGAPRRPVPARDVEPMLCELEDSPPDSDGWVWEIKLDGYRALCVKDDRARVIYARKGREVTPQFPELQLALATLPHESLVLDGEIIATGPDGMPSFNRLQLRAGKTGEHEVRLAVVHQPIRFIAFDLLAFAGFDLRPLPLLVRKAMLARLLPQVGPITLSQHFAVPGKKLLESAVKMGLEGVVGKRADSPYKPGRHSTWVKIKPRKTADLIVVGYTPQRGTTDTLGALRLAWRDDSGILREAGGAGSGISARIGDELLRQVTPYVVKKRPPEVDPRYKVEPGMVWLRPELVCEVQYAEWTETGTLRFPIYVRLRDDKTAADACDRPRHLPPQALAVSKEVQATESLTMTVVREETLPKDDPPLSLTNLKKVFWPELGHTKGDLIDYYRAIAPWLLPLLRDRPLVMTRFPDGIHGKSFFQKDAPAYAPPWVRTRSMWSAETGKENKYILADDERTLLWTINTGCIPLHVWASRLGALSQPDWTIVDFDPKGAPFERVITLALALRELCDDIGLASFVKTSGQAGMHVVIPLGTQTTFDQGRDLALLLAKVIVDTHPTIATIDRSLDSQGTRGGKVYLDCLQNGHGKLIVAPYAARPVPTAGVSTPLFWDEVRPGLDPRFFTIRSLPERMRTLPADPWAEVLTAPAPDLLAVLGRLQRRLQK